jgi:hypothetical protein
MEKCPPRRNLLFFSEAPIQNALRKDPSISMKIKPFIRQKIQHWVSIVIQMSNARRDHCPRNAIVL